MGIISQLKLSLWIAKLLRIRGYYIEENQGHYMGTMKIARTNLICETLSTVARDASCSRGWLRVVVQTIFALITVTSFILIVLMAMQNTNLIPVNRPRPESSRCSVNNCLVLCNDAPYFDLYEDHILFAIADAEITCKRIHLLLNNASFINSTLPANWLSKMRTDHIYDLSIHQGNLMHIAAGAFMGHFAGNIRTISLEDITIQTIGDHSFIGLFSLENIFIRKSNITDIETNAMRPIDDTLQSLTVTQSNHWNPVNVTGTTEFSRLTIVDFSFNLFIDILDSSSFTGLGRCKVLYLNSCKITALGPGTFDHLHSIDIIYLNNNLLVTIPPGLFNNIMSVIPKPRINLQDNLWHCDCSVEDLRLLVRKDLLYVEPLCHNPENVKDKTFTEFEGYCNSMGFRKFTLDKTFCNKTYVQLKDNVYINGTCHEDSIPSLNSSLRMLSPVLMHKCPTSAMSDISVVKYISNINMEESTITNKWLKLKFFLQADKYTVVQMDSSGTHGYGLIWYQSTCPEIIYCLNILPTFLTVYNIDFNARYTFCPIDMNSSIVEVENCIHYDTSRFQIHIQHNSLQVVMYFFTGIVCLIFGALCVYALVRKNPTLLRGSKRIVFVKHKTVDALVLPPKVPLRNTFVSLTPPNENVRKIFIVSNDKLHANKFSTLKSVKSNNSNSPSYISALQPTDDQLAEWRIRHHFNNDLTLSSISDISNFSWLYKGDSVYYSLESDSEKTSEGAK